MSGSKHFDKIAWAVTAVILVIAVLFINGEALGIKLMDRYMGYEDRLFDNTRVHTIDIVMDDWDSFIDNAQSEEYYAASLVIDGEAYKNVGIRGKGNTSLSTVSSLNSQRYSFKVEFDQYDSTKSYHGLDKLSLNNLIQDSTKMKDYLTYTMMAEFGAVAPLCSFVYITVNGEDWGLYLAVEGIEDGFLQRNYGSDYGELYKPDSMSFGGGRGNGKNFDISDFMSSDSGQSFDGFDPSSAFGNGQMGNLNFGGMGGFGMGSSDVKLQYIDDSIDSYSNIWNNAKTDITAADQQRLIESLYKLSEYQQLESVVDVESVIRYFVVHNYVCNGDSYTGSMVHNYYLYEKDGQLSMIPWDYNLAYGTFQGGNAQSTLNTPIDSPMSNGTGDDRPMWYWILSDESYTQLYHQYYEEFLGSVDVSSIIDNAYVMIKEYVAKDPTAFYTYDEFETGVQTLRSFCELRTESIMMQLENNETVETMDYADASGLDLSAMGSMGMGGGGFDGTPDIGGGADGFDNGGRWNNNTDGDSSENSSDKNPSFRSDGWASLTSFEQQDSQFPDFSGGFDLSQMPNGFNGSMPEGFDSSMFPGGFGGGTFDPQQGANGQRPNGWGDIGSNGTMPENGGDQSSNIPSSSGSNVGFAGQGSSGGNVALIWLIVSFVILAGGLAVAKIYRY